MKEDYKTRNNIFYFATKELSQDALLCWLINGYNFKDEELYPKSKTLLDHILKSYNHDLNIEDYNILKIERQFCHIDIYVLLENKKNEEKIGIIIEDKKLTSEHDNQIANYKEKLKKLKEFNGKEIITVYYKPYEEINELQKDVIKIDRQYMLKNIFNSFLNNQIYLDYKVYLEEIEEIYQNLESIPICEWEKRKEIYYMFAKKYNQNIKYSDKKMKVVQFNGSTFIDWYEINKLSGELSTIFKKVYLSLNINYEKYELRIRGIAQKECSRQAREKVEQQISNLCNEENLKTSSFSYRKIKENSNIFIAKINLIPEDKCKELLEKIKILESILNSII